MFHYTNEDDWRPLVKRLICATAITWIFSFIGGVAAAGGGMRRDDGCEDRFHEGRSKLVITSFI